MRSRLWNLKRYNTFFGHKVVDGSRQLRIIEWPKVGNMETITRLLTERMIEMIVPDFAFIVILDTYREPTTKSSEQKRRNEKSPGPDVAVNPNTPIPRDKTAFLSNTTNKQSLINLWESSLQHSDIPVILADEGDADTEIVFHALAIAKTGVTVKVVANDTDILVMLVHHFDRSIHADIFYMGTFVISIGLLSALLGKSMCDCLPFVHAGFGCDTTSAWFHIGKVKPYEIVSKSETYQKAAMVFGDTESDLEDLTNFGIELTVKLYSNKIHSSLESLRYDQFTSSILIPPERRAPSARVVYFHFLRVHHQVATFRHLKTMMPPEDFGFVRNEMGYEPIITDMEPAPPELLRNIRCSCTSSKSLCSQCTCTKYGIPCSSHCKCNGDCSNPEESIDDTPELN